MHIYISHLEHSKQEILGFPFAVRPQTFPDKDRRGLRSRELLILVSVWPRHFPGSIETCQSSGTLAIFCGSETRPRCLELSVAPSTPIPISFERGSRLSVVKFLCPRSIAASLASSRRRRAHDELGWGWSFSRSPFSPAKPDGSQLPQQCF